MPDPLDRLTLAQQKIDELFGAVSLDHLVGGHEQR
jgi:hypothetical protein